VWHVQIKCKAVILSPSRGVGISNQIRRDQEIGSHVAVGWPGLVAFIKARVVGGFGFNTDKLKSIASKLIWAPYILEYFEAQPLHKQYCESA
jgi:hypothetical protein